MYVVLICNVFSLIFYLYFLPILDDEGPVAAIITVSVLSVVNQVPERETKKNE